MFHAAGQTVGVRSNALVESVDIYPTLANVKDTIKGSLP